MFHYDRKGLFTVPNQLESFIMDCSICQFLRDALIDIDEVKHYPYPRTKAHKDGIEDLAVRHYRRYHPNPFGERGLPERQFMNRD